MGEGFTPLADVEETDEAYLVEVELAGVKGDDIQVEVAGRRLSVSGERKERERVGILRPRPARWAGSTTRWSFPERLTMRGSRHLSTTGC